jgi:phosphoribosylaminoimidazole-succinocarboxamide synthase
MKDEPNEAVIQIASNGKMSNALRTKEGKTKRVWWDSTVLIESKDDITAGDGARRHVIPGKGALATETTANCFRLLEREGIGTHFVERVSPTSFRALDCIMYPIEVVTRRIVTGSYSQRHPLMYEGISFLNEPNVEFFLKDDASHDPLLVRDDATDDWLLYDAHRPIAEGPIDCWWSDALHEVKRNVDGARAAEMTAIARRAFLALEAAWAKQDVALVDLKIEFGFARATKALLVADVIDNDSWRIWPERNKAKMLDKQVYRDLAVVTPEHLATIRGNYAKVAEATARFLA